jgi:hypothetical protein
MQHDVAEVKYRLKQALRSAMSNDSDKSGTGDKPDSPDPRVTRGFGTANCSLNGPFPVMVFTSVQHVLGGGVALRCGLQRRNEVSTMEVRSDRTPQTARGEERTTEAGPFNIFSAPPRYRGRRADIPKTIGLFSLPFRSPAPTRPGRTAPDPACCGRIP